MRGRGEPVQAIGHLVQPPPGDLLDHVHGATEALAEAWHVEPLQGLEGIAIERLPLRHARVGGVREPVVEPLVAGDGAHEGIDLEQAVPERLRRGRGRRLLILHAHLPRSSPRARKARPRWLMAFFSWGGSSAIVRASPTGTNTGS
jgi:hypothetical protein